MADSNQLANSPDARSPTGEILPPEKREPSETNKSNETPTNDGKTDDQVEGKTEGAEEDEGEGSLLNPKKKPDAKKEEGKDGDKKDDKKDGAPEKYEDFKVPDGYKLDTAVVEKATGLFKELGLSQEGAQKLIDLYAQNQVEANGKAQQGWKDVVDGWAQESNNDADLKGKLSEDGPVLTTIAKALDQIGDVKLVNAFKKTMDTTGVGNKSDFIKVFYKLASMVTEGKQTKGNGPTPPSQKAPESGPVTAAQAIFPNLK